MPIAANVVLGANVRIHHPDLVNLYGCAIGNDVDVGPFVEVQAGCSIGAGCKIASHSFICGGVVLEEEVMVGHGVMITNDWYPQPTRPEDNGDMDSVAPTRVCRGVVIGANVTIIAGITIGPGAVIAPGSTVVGDVPANAYVIGAPARPVDPQAMQMPTPLEDPS